jgi:hypothetical protein
MNRFSEPRQRILYWSLRTSARSDRQAWSEPDNPLAVDLLISRLRKPASNWAANLRSATEPSRNRDALIMPPDIRHTWPRFKGATGLRRFFGTVRRSKLRTNVWANCALYWKPFAHGSATLDIGNFTLLRRCTRTERARTSRREVIQRIATWMPNSSRPRGQATWSRNLEDSDDYWIALRQFVRIL